MRYSAIVSGLTFAAMSTLVICTGEQSDENPLPTLERYFSRALYKRLALDSGGRNLLVSPLSVHVVLSVLMGGTEGKARQELMKVLGLDQVVGLPDQRIRDLYKELLSLIKNSSFQLVTRLFLDKSIRVNEEFVNDTQKYYDTGVETVDMLNKRQTVKAVNDFVMRTTDDNIRGFLHGDEVQEECKLICVATSHLQGLWAVPFPTQLTVKQSFQPLFSSGKHFSVDMMHMKAHLHFLHDETLHAKIVALNFTEPRLSMLLVLPDSTADLYQLEARLSAMDHEPLFHLVLSAPPTRVQLALPRFRLQSDLHLEHTLKQMGLVSLMSATADLSGISNSSSPELHVSQIHQKTYLDVAEGGVEAAMTTVVQISNDVDKGTWQLFKADRPFLFYILWEEVVIFQGRLVEP